ncbi:cadherin-2-like isoform X1 [Electrophorus electricus]|uniref:cadherin-2-like isoform X1 n=1 Tax=Electrophorus electricus TaxID=8005 RepID=UPI0015CFF7D2|nr:cadherin-2-like isoform X1 [Electrophorus electricus]
MICSLLLLLLQGLVTTKDLSPGQNCKGADFKEAAHSLAKCHQDVPVLEFPKSSVGLKRRNFVTHPIFFPENDRGPFPRKMTVQIKSLIAKEAPVWYSITGEGADQPPKGLFTVDKNSGWLYVSMPLDREKKDKYELQAHAVAQDGNVKEQPVDIVINVIDQNDNRPIFTQDPFRGSVAEASNIGFEIMTVTATDADDPSTDNADVRYTILSQIPAQPNPNMFSINPVSGAILVGAEGLDREKYPEYTLEIQAADMRGNGYAVKGNAVITITDSNDNAPQFEKTSYNVSVPENKVGAVVVKLPVTDEDEPQSSAWAAKFRIVGGNSGGLFNVSTGLKKQEGIITTVKPLDFERNSKYTLLVIVENEIQFAKLLPTSTATVTVNVIDVNEAPVFDPEKKTISIPEDQKVGNEITVYTASDPDTAKSQKVKQRSC